MLLHKTIKYSFLISITALLASCYNMYYISVDNLHQELNKIKDTASAYKHKFYDAVVFTKLFNNGLTQITCLDKNGKPIVIGVYSNTVAIITTKDGDVDKLLLSTMFAKDSTLYGQLSFLASQVKINFRDIQSIKIKSPKSPPEN